MRDENTEQQKSKVKIEIYIKKIKNVLQNMKTPKR